MGSFRLPHALPGSQKRLGRHTGPSGTFPANQLALDDYNAEATFLRSISNVFTGCARANNNYVIVVGHFPVREV